MPAPGSFTPEQLDDAIKRYLAGEGRLLVIAKSLGISAPRFIAAMAEKGVRPRTRTEAQAMRHIRDADTEWKRNFTAAARRTTQEWIHSDANRERMSKLGSRVGKENVGTIASPERLERRANAQEERGLKISPFATRLNDWLIERGLTTTMEQACGRYNIDIAVPPVAVEVHRYSAHPFGRAGARLRQRAHYIGNRDWTVLYVWISARAWLLTEDAADDVVAYVQRTQADPSLIGQYRVIRGTGEFVASGSLNGDDFA